VGAALLLLALLPAHLGNRPLDFPLDLLRRNILDGFASFIEDFKLLCPLLFQPSKQD
jgi:hypothetical protein